VRIEFLPPYSPDFNPIEEAFSKFKAWLRRNYDLFSAAAHNDGIMYDLREALDIITAEDAQGYMRHSGYF
jgi:transposase